MPEPTLSYTLQVRLRSPAAISSERGGSYQSSTLAEVPAQAVRGCIASLLEAAAPGQPELMPRLFGENGIRTTALLPAYDDADRTATPFPAPLTLRTCKQYPGLVGTSPSGHPQHGVEDTLFAAMAFAMNGDARHLDALQFCPRCRESAKKEVLNVLKTFRGVLRQTPRGFAFQPDPDRRVQVHVGIDRRRGGAAARILYAREVISEQADGGAERFRASVTGPAPLMRILAQHLKKGVTLHVGTAVSRGLGRCDVDDFKPSAPLEPLARRIERFDEAARAYMGPRPEGVLIAFTLQTPALFVDDFLRPNTTPDGADLLQEAQADEDAFARALAQLSPVFRLSRPFSFTGWNGMAGFPHYTDQGLSAGSVLVFSGGLLDETLLAALAHVEAHGIGLRRHLGFGRVSVCAPVHTGLHQLAQAHHSHG